CTPTPVCCRDITHQCGFRKFSISEIDLHHVAGVLVAVTVFLSPPLQYGGGFLIHRTLQHCFVFRKHVEAHQVWKSVMIDVRHVNAHRKIDRIDERLLPDSDECTVLSDYIIVVILMKSVTYIDIQVYIDIKIGSRYPQSVAVDSTIDIRRVAYINK